MKNLQSIKNRSVLLRKKLKKFKLNCLIVTKPANVTYLTGFSGDDSWAVCTQKNTFLITDSRYTRQAQKECKNCQIIQRQNPMHEEIALLLKKLKITCKTGIENTVDFSVYEGLKKKLKTKIKPVSSIIETLREIKDPAEIALIKKAARIAHKALANIKKYIKPGITENQLAGLLELEIRKLGAKPLFDTIVAFGPNAARPHHQPTLRKLKQNDSILIDFGTKQNGYCCDITRCFTVGKPGNLYRKVYRTVQKAQAAASSLIKDGAEISRIEQAAKDVIKESNLPPFGHGTGHGLGLEVHESPVVCAKSKQKLKAGQIITIEPAVYIPNKLGVRIEDDILVTKTGFKILSGGIE